MSNTSSSFQPHLINDARKLAHPVSTLIIGVAGMVFFLGITVVSNAFPNCTVTIWTTLGFLAFAMLSIPVIDAYFREWHEVSENGMSYARLFGGRRNLKWSDVVSIRFSRYCGWFVIRTNTGEVARVSLFLKGIPEFSRLVLSNVPRAVIVPDALSIMESAAAFMPEDASQRI